MTQAYFMENQEARATRAERTAIKLGNQTARVAINLFVKTMDQTIKELLYPTVAIQQGFLNRCNIYKTNKLNITAISYIK